MNNCKKKRYGKKIHFNLHIVVTKWTDTILSTTKKGYNKSFLLISAVQFNIFCQQLSEIQLIGLSSSSLSSWLSRQNNTSKLLFREYSRKKALTCESKYLSCGCRCLSCSCRDFRRLKAKLVTTAQRELSTCQDLGPGNTEFLQNTSAASLYTVAKLSTRFLWSNARRRVKRT